MQAFDIEKGIEYNKNIYPQENFSPSSFNHFSNKIILNPLL